MKTVLSDPVYTKLATDRTNKIERRTTALIKKVGIPEEDAKKLIPHVPASPRLYGLPKIHKKNVPLRHVVNCIGSPTYEVPDMSTQAASCTFGSPH